MKKICIIVLLISLAAVSEGQTGDKQAGIRLGYRGGLFYQVTSTSGNTETGYNLMLGFTNGIQLTGLRMIYGGTVDRISPALQLNWGYGIHAGLINTEQFGEIGEYTFHEERLSPAIGVDLFGGMEYRFPNAPVALSLNLKPFVEISAPYHFRLIPFDIGLSVAYTF